MPKKKSGNKSGKNTSARRVVPAATKNTAQGSLHSEIIGVVLVAVSILVGMAVYSSDGAMYAVAVRSVSFGCFGIAGYILPELMAAVGVLLILSGRQINISKLKTAMAVIAVMFAFTFMHVVNELWFNAENGYFAFLGQSYTVCAEHHIAGGVLGGILAYPMLILLGKIPSIIICIAVVLICIMIITNLSLRKVSKDIGDKISETYTEHKKIKTVKNKTPLFVDNIATSSVKSDKLKLFTEEKDEKAEEDIAFDIPTQPEETYVQEQPKPKRAVKQKAEPVVEEDQTDFDKYAAEKPQNAEYVKPPVTLLVPAQNDGIRGGRGEAAERAALLERTLQNFAVSAKVVNICRGPVVTRYELQPAPGVKVSRIVSLQDDIALNLAASGMRIEAPIPGKAAIGIEIPNNERTTVLARELIDNPDFRRQKSKLAFAVGKDIAGKNIYADLAKMPHLLISGTTGSGKSVCENMIITSMLYNATPEELQFIMVDPKMVELTPFNGIPHLRIPVVTDPKKAAGAVNWAVSEMVSRYKAFSLAGVKEIEKYNELLKADGKKILPKIVVIIDELADLMMVAAKDVEDAICRIAQLGRASGIHLIIATQRPSVDVITGLIKANIPSRIALKASSQVDSRTMLDCAGAEKLLGNGDMLYYPTGMEKPMRVQGCWLSPDEVERVTDFLKNQNTAPVYDDACSAAVENAGVNQSIQEGQEMDSMLPKAIELAIEYEQISISMLQRRLRVGYSRAARLVDEMEELGAVSAADGSKPRQVLITRAEFENMFNNSEESDD